MLAVKALLLSAVLLLSSGRVVHSGRPNFSRWWREVVDSETQVQGYGCCRS